VTALQLIDIKKRYGPAFALGGVSLTVAAGEVHALVGENGAGKSTLLKIMAGVVSPTDGQMLLGGSPVLFDRLDPEHAQRLGVSVVHQEFSLVPAMSVAENIFLGREPRRFRLLDRSGMAKQAGQLLARLGSRISPTRSVDSLTVAECQIVEIAKALSVSAQVVAMDEPSAVLSGPELEQLFRVIEALRKEGVALLYVSHRLDEVFQICDRYTVLKDGVVSGSGLIKDVSRTELVVMMVGREVSQVFPPPRASPGAPRLEARSLLVAGLAAPVDFVVRAGEIVGLAGLNGAGRTTLARGLFGALPATGDLLIDSERKGPFHSTAEAMACGLAFLPEDRRAEGLALEKTVSANATLNVLASLRRGPLLSSSAERDIATGAIARFDIRTHRNGGATSGSLSGGNQQKVVLAKWLAARPRVVVLDEPTRGIDIGSKEQIYAILRSLADEGLAVLVISSELIEVLGLSDRVLVMADGRIVGELAHAEATEERVLGMITAATRHETALGATP